MTGNKMPSGIKIPSWKYTEIERLVVKLYKEQNINRVPIDPFDIIKKRGYILIPFSKFKKGTRPECANKNNDAFSLYDPDLKTSFIIYNDDKTLLRIRFTLMHEVGHIDLGHKGESCLAKVMADYYAAYALAPSPLIEKFASEEIPDIVSTFAVTSPCAERCSNGYNNWRMYSGRYLKDYEIDLINLVK